MVIAGKVAAGSCKVGSLAAELSLLSPNHPAAFENDGQELPLQRENFTSDPERTTEAFSHFSLLLTFQ